MRIARAVATAGTCDRAKVGAVLVKNGAIIGTGYNGSARGDLHCATSGHIMHAGHCVRTIHAEENAILNAAKSGTSTLGATLFCTHEPCYRCCQRLINAGISRVYYWKSYGKYDEARAALCTRSELAMEQY